MTEATSGWLPAMRGETKSIELRRERTDLRALLASALVPLVSAAREQRIELRVDALGDLPPMAVDRERMAWAVVTLAGNALRYVTRGDARTGEPGGCVIVHLHHDVARGVTIAVHDDGPGVPPEQLPYLFQRRAGALHADGLGLLLVRDVVAAHGGRIEVETRSGTEEHGTSIAMILP